MLRLGDATLMLNTAYEDGERPPAPDPPRVRGHADVSLYFDVPDTEAVYAFLREKGCDVNRPAVMTWGMKMLSVKDLDGFELCFVSPLEST